jgi:hydroxymethylpyrimidine pyrophosphatase-like HAD family hydrolase
MTIEMPYCNFKCDHECGKLVCQNGALAHSPNINYAIESIIQVYKNNPITRAVVFQGLEPFDSIDDLRDFIFEFRNCYSINDDIVIYTGYNKDEIENYLIQLKQFSNIVVKFGRYIPDCESHFDPILGVKLASPNQYAERIS